MGGGRSAHSFSYIAIASISGIIDHLYGKEGIPLYEPGLRSPRLQPFFYPPPCDLTARFILSRWIVDDTEVKVEVLEYHLFPEMGINSYLLWDPASREALLIDPAAPSNDLLNKIRELELKVKFIVCTHGHGDHIGGNEFFKQQLSAPLAIHSEDAEMLGDPTLNLSAFFNFPISSPAPDRLLTHGEVLHLGECPVRVIHTPGHTPGGICLLTENLLLTGDTLFMDSVGRTDFPNGDADLLENMIRARLMILPDDTLIYPGHGPQSTIGHERHHNPFVGSWEENEL
jgi:hydroxyacylglutathione hydrolase